MAHHIVEVFFIERVRGNGGMLGRIADHQVDEGAFIGGAVQYL